MTRKVKRINRTTPLALTVEQQEHVRKGRLDAPFGAGAKAITEKRRQKAIQAELADVTAALKAAREAAGISLRELETQTGIGRGNLSRLESGTSNPTLATLQRYAEAIGKKITVTVQ